MTNAGNDWEKTGNAKAVGLVLNPQMLARVQDFQK
jgi:hypothetical protein